MSVLRSVRITYSATRSTTILKVEIDTFREYSLELYTFRGALARADTATLVCIRIGHAIFIWPSTSPAAAAATLRTARRWSTTRPRERRRQTTSRNTNDHERTTPTIDHQHQHNHIHYLTGSTHTASGRSANSLLFAHTLHNADPSRAPFCFVCFHRLYPAPVRDKYTTQFCVF